MPWRMAASSMASWKRPGSAALDVAAPSRAVTIEGISRQ